eukprot:8700124-Lingulodinium_polyedra.AAC.1
MLSGPVLRNLERAAHGRGQHYSCLARRPLNEPRTGGLHANKESLALATHTTCPTTPARPAANPITKHHRRSWQRPRQRCQRNRQRKCIHWLGTATQT